MIDDGTGLREHIIELELERAYALGEEGLGFDPKAAAKRLAALSAVAPPPDWVLVPREPTAEMREAGKSAHNEAEDRCHAEAHLGAKGMFLRANRAAHIYAAMLATSPAAPAQPAMQAAPVAFVTDGDVYTLIGHAAVMRMRGESDMSAYSLDLAQRIALTIGDRHLADRCDELAALPQPPTGE